MKEKQLKADVSIKQKLYMQEARAQKLIHDTNSYAFQPATALPNITSLLCLKLFKTNFLCFINCECEATTQRASIFILSVSLLFPILFTSRCSPLLY